MEIKSKLKYILSGRVTIVGVGNRLRGDDGFGATLAERLQNKTFAYVINAGPTPENHIKAIRYSKPNTILILDATDFGGNPGDVKLWKRQDIPLYGLSTHNSSLRLFFDFLKEDTKAGVYMLAVQPADVDMNSDLSKVVNKRCKELESLFLELLPKR